jgi:hypothetical protein
MSHKFTVHVEGADTAAKKALTHLLASFLEDSVKHVIVPGERMSMQKIFGQMDRIQDHAVVEFVTDAPVVHTVQAVVAPTTVAGTAPTYTAATVSAPATVSVSASAVDEDGDALTLPNVAEFLPPTPAKALPQHPATVMARPKHRW